MLVIDILKAVLAILIAKLLFGQSHQSAKILIALYAGIGAILGHSYPLFFGFKGGKGIATMLGVFAVANPLATLIVILCAAATWLLFKYGSLASFVCVTALTAIEGFHAKSLAAPSDFIVSMLLFAIFVLTWWAHRSNIQRLILGKESKVDLIASAKKKIKNNTVGK